MDTRTRYETEFQRIGVGVAQMGALLIEMLKALQKLLKQQNSDLISQIYKSDHVVNDYELKLIHRSVRLLNLEQPVASDLRHLICIIRSVSDLERIGDHIVHIAKILDRRSNDRRPMEIELFPTMIDWVMQMLEQSLSALALHDPDIAEQVIEHDRTLDEMHKKVLQKIMNSIQKHTELFETATQMLFFSRFLERIGDHIVNVCEWSLYSSNGQLQGERHHND